MHHHQVEQHFRSFAMERLQIIEKWRYRQGSGFPGFGNGPALVASVIRTLRSCQRQWVHETVFHNLRGNFLLGAAGTVRAQDAPPPQYDRPAQQQPDDDDAAPQPDQNQADQIQIQDEAADSASRVSSNSRNQQQQQQRSLASRASARFAEMFRRSVTTRASGLPRSEHAAGTRRPLSTGDRSRAELQLDFADTLRMSSRVTVKIANLTRSQIQLQVGRDSPHIQ